MRMIVAGVPREYADEYAIRLMEQGRAIPAPIPAPIFSASVADAAETQQEAPEAAETQQEAPEKSKTTKRRK